MNAHYIGRMRFEVLGPVTAHDDAGDAVALGGPRHRAVLARLLVARGHVVPVGRLVDDLWEEPPADAVGAIRTFVAGLRRALEPDRPPRTPARLLVTEGPGYAVRADRAAVDAWRFDEALGRAANLPAAAALPVLTEALDWWRGPAYADFADADWARAERSRLTEQRLLAVERRAAAQLDLGAAAAAVPDLDAHVAEHPWREEAWLLLATALYRAGRQADALAVVQRARRMLAEHLGIDPGPRLRRLELDLLRQADHLDPADPATQVWEQARAAYDRTVTGRARTRLESTAALMRDLAVTGAGGLEAARTHHLAAVAAATELGDPELTARVIGIYDVPAIWTRSDDPAQAARLVATAEQTLLRLPAHNDAARARLLATIAVESRGLLPTGSSPTEPTASKPESAYDTGKELPSEKAQIAPQPGGSDFTPQPADHAARHAPANAENSNPRPGDASGPESPNAAEIRPADDASGAGWRPLRAAREAEEIARRLRDPGLLAFALNGVFMQSFERAGLAGRRERVGREILAVAERNQLTTYAVLGHLVCLQARCGLGEREDADRHAEAVDVLAARHDLPLVAVFTQWYRALRAAETTDAETAVAGYRRAAVPLAEAGMPGLQRGLLPLAELIVSLRHRDSERIAAMEADWGPYAQWVRPTLLVARGEVEQARTALRHIEFPPRDLLFELLWAVLAQAAIAVDDVALMREAQRQLSPAHAETTAQSGLLEVGAVRDHLAELTAALAGRE
ncbi:AfsR/SARP family transcriptional regulator [Nocardia sp. NPDC048505]|uniref:AfsR/SARP family transcriptional regulator n=1 Tax=unclassified Nocardia TaxID=2637762 RepID=UPI003407DE1B